MGILFNLMPKIICAGVHINAVGACTPTTRELSGEVVAKSSFFVDWMESAEKESGDYLLAVKEGSIKKDHIKGELSQVVAGKVKARESEEEITIFKSLGIAVEDVICAQYLFTCVSKTDADE